MKILNGIMAFLILGTALVGCQAAISKEIRAEADESLTFEQVFSNPDPYRGKVVLWGGVILETKNTPEGAVIEVLQRPLAANDRPRRDAKSSGRFLVLHKGFLDPAIYGRGREITVAGRVAGKRSRTLDEIEYTYPVIEERQLVLWRPGRGGPDIHFGIGLGTTIIR